MIFMPIPIHPCEQLWPQRPRWTPLDQRQIDKGASLHGVPSVPCIWGTPGHRQLQMVEMVVVSPVEVTGEKQGNTNGGVLQEME